MSNLTGTLIIAPIVPPTTDDRYGTHYAKYGVGGYRTVSDIIERDNIPTERRENLMLVSVESTNKIYQLSGSLTNSGWIEFSVGSSSTGSVGSSGVAYVDKRYVDVADNMSSLHVAGGFASGYIDLFVNGIKLIRDYEYNDNSPPNVSFNNPILSGSVLEYVTYTQQTSYMDVSGSINFSHSTETMIVPTYSLDFSAANIQVVQPVGASITVQFNNIHFGRIVYLKLKKNTTTDYNLILPSQSVFFSGNSYMVIPQNKCVGISATCCGETESDVDVAVATEL